MLGAAAGSKASLALTGSRWHAAAGSRARRLFVGAWQRLSLSPQPILLASQSTDVQTGRRAASDGHLGAEPGAGGVPSRELGGASALVGDCSSRRGRGSRPDVGGGLLTAADVVTGAVDVKGWRVVLEATGEEIGTVDELLDVVSQVELADVSDDGDGSCETAVHECMLQVTSLSTKVSPPLPAVSSKRQSEHGAPICPASDARIGGITGHGLEVAIEVEHAEEVKEGKEEEGPCIATFLVPFVDAIVKRIDATAHCLLIDPPAGLLELGHREGQLDALEPLLSEFWEEDRAGRQSCLLQSWQNPRNVEESAEADERMRRAAQGCDGGRPDRWLSDSRLGQPYMPTRRQLVAAGRQDIVARIAAAGGFLSVAEALGLRARRRPNGFWEDLRNVDAEIEWLVSSEAWVRSSAKAATAAAAAEGGVAIMPQAKAVRELGRYDLHNAIMMHGGYKDVAAQLGRRPASAVAIESLADGMRSFMSERGMNVIPRYRQLRAEGRQDLIAALKRHGGPAVLADYMGLRCSRHGKGHWHQEERAVQALREYVLTRSQRTGRAAAVTVQPAHNGQATRGTRGSLAPLNWKPWLDHEHDNPGCFSFVSDCSDFEEEWEAGCAAGLLVMPSNNELLQQRRHDLRYIIQKVGRAKLCQLMGLPERRSRKQRRTSKLAAGITTPQDSAHDAGSDRAR
eukprot:SM000035S13038  [mRNA]  locus=s35:59115:63032:+ [translate_table: standard]